MPRRRWVGRTPTTVTPPQRTGSARHRQLERKRTCAAQIRSPSKAACIRSIGRLLANRSAPRPPGPAPEVVPDCPDRGLELLDIPGRPDIPGHQNTSGQYGGSRCGRAAPPPPLRLRGAPRPGRRARAGGSRRRRDRRREVGDVEREIGVSSVPRRRRRRGSGRVPEQRSSVTSSTTGSPGLYERALRAASRSTRRIRARRRASARARADPER